jgi:ELMO/CED-12 family
MTMLAASSPSTTTPNKSETANGTTLKASPRTSSLPSSNAATPPMAPLLSRWAVATSHAVAQWTAKTYALPDKTVASQVLMYRQLLHTPCKPGLKLSRPYQGTPAQKSVAHMPWWETVTTHEQREDGTTETIVLTMKETGKMVISYDNLIARLWIKGTKQEQKHELAHEAADSPNDLLDTLGSTGSETATDASNSFVDKSVANGEQHPQRTSDDTAPKPLGLPLPPIPHEFWVSQLGFQQKDPVTDFRSGGVLSLAMMVWIVESCPDVYARFDRSGSDPAAVLPFGITSINVTDMMAKFLMLSKNTDRMDALLSQKPFWSMFSDPYALLTCQELALDMLADVVSELVAVRTIQRTLDAAAAATDIGDAPADSTVLPTQLVTVFDFTHILSVTESRVEHDLLGAGPLSVADLRRIHGSLQTKYQRQLQAKLDRMVKKNGAAAAAAAPATPNKDVMSNNGESAGSNPIDPSEGEMHRPSVSSPSPLHEKVLSHATGVSAAATGFLNQAVLKLNPLGGFRTKNRAADATQPPPSEPLAVPNSTESIDFATVPGAATAATLDNATHDAICTTETEIKQMDLLNDFDEWIGAAMEQPNAAAASSTSPAPFDLPMTNFSIGADEDEFLDPTTNVPL